MDEFSHLTNFFGVVVGVVDGVVGREREGGVPGGVENTLLRNRLVPAGRDEAFKRLENEEE